jgi:TolB-like protein/Tfp pilus assembly protein PilF/predicted Ser/Thr protein kinase
MPLGSLKKEPSPTQTLPPSFFGFSTGTYFADRYQVIEELGGGGMGKVYKVLDTKIHEKIALKIIRPDIAGSPRVIDRFRQELKLARQITHKNICRMYDLGEDLGTSFITMEFVSGEPLKNIIRMTGPLTAGAAVDYAGQIAEGLAEAHKLGVIHRDLKPQNIMVDEAGTIKIMDFGIARSLESAAMTGEGKVIGTPEYMSPEQADGRPADRRSDIYALGMIFFEMLIGKTPFAAESAARAALKQKTEAPPAPRELNSQIPAELSDIVLKCLAQDPDQRFQTAEEFLSELRKLDGLIPKTTDKRPGGVTRTATSGIRRRLFAAAIVPALLAIGLGIYLLFIKKAPVRPEKIVLAVLPFKDQTPEQNRSFLCEVMTDDIRVRLADIDSLAVIGKDSSDQYRSAGKTAKEFGRELGAEQILTGTLRVAEGLISATVELSGVEDETITWSRPYERPFDNKKNLFQVEKEIAADIAGQLKVELTPAVLSEPANLEALTEYKWGRNFENLYRDSRKDTDFEEAVKHYHAAAEADPDYVLAFCGLGSVYESRFIRTKKSEDLAAMRGYFEKAHELNPKVPESNIGMGWSRFYAEDFDGAYDSFEKALDARPDDPDINYGVGSFLRSIGLYESAIRHYRRTLDLEPLSYGAHLTSIACFSYTGDLEKALSLARKAVDLAPNNSRTHIYCARQLLFLEKYEDAEKEIARAENISPGEPTIARLKAWIAAAQGRREEALSLIKDVEPPYIYDVTNIYSLLEMTDKVLENIQAGIAQGLKGTGDYLYGYPYLANNRLFDPLRRDSRFKEILSTEKKKYDEKMKKYGGL